MEFFECLADFGDKRATGGGCYDVVWGFPPQLLDEFKAERFRAFRVKRPDVNVNERPGVNAGDFTAEPVYLVVGAHNTDDGGRVDKRRDDFAELQIGGNEDVAVQIGDGGVCGDRIREVACGRARDSIKIEFLRFAERDCHHPVFERERRVAD